MNDRIDGINKQLANLVRQYTKHRITRVMVEIQAKNIYARVYPNESSVNMAVVAFMKTIR